MTRFTTSIRIETEWPTIAVAAAIYAGFLGLTYFHESIPWWALVLPGGFIVAWHGSLQHEVVHGHPTTSGFLNRLLILPALSLWLPFEIYRDTHLRHHRDEHLTDPRIDPESFYLTADQWRRSDPLSRALLLINSTLAGRLLLGPFLLILRLPALLFRELRTAPSEIASILGLHLLGASLVVVWVTQVCGMSFAVYLACFVYPGLSLTLIRSYLEHQARPDVPERTVVVEAGPLLSLLFLNNNLHAAHHRDPSLPWYALPRAYRLMREEILSENGGYRFGGYLEIARRFLFRPKEPVVHPSEHAGTQDRGTPMTPEAARLG